MHMVRHQYPSQQAIAAVVVEPEVVLHDLGHARVSQMAGAVTGIQKTLDPAEFLAFVLKLERSPPFVEKAGRYRIRQSVGDELPGARCIEVRQVASRIPSLEPRLLRFRRRLK